MNTIVFKPTLKEGKRPIVSKKVGSKEIKMIYDNDPSTPEPVKNIPTTPEERNAYVISDDEILAARPLGLHHRGPLRPGHGYRMGQGR